MYLLHFSSSEDEKVFSFAEARLPPVPCNRNDFKESEEVEVMPLAIIALRIMLEFHLLAFVSLLRNLP